MDINTITTPFPERLRAAAEVAHDVSKELGLPDAGVVLMASFKGNDLFYVLWTVRRAGGIREHSLDVSCTDRERLVAHAQGFTETHLRDWS